MELDRNDAETIVMSSACHNMMANTSQMYFSFMKLMRAHPEIENDGELLIDIMDKYGEVLKSYDIVRQYI
jgi:hypothetical protein